MSTQSMHRPPGRLAWRARESGLARLGLLILVVLVAFIAAYLIAHAGNQAGTQGAEGLAGSPPLATPVPSRLAAAPPIEVGVQAAHSVRSAPAHEPANATSTPAAPAPASVVPSSAGGAVAKPPATGSGGGTATAPGAGSHSSEPSVSFDSSG